MAAASSAANHGTYLWAALPFNGEPECEAVHAQAGAAALSPTALAVQPAAGWSTPCGA
jgi:hypothetical protein